MKFAICPMTQHDLDEVMLLAAGCDEAPHWSRAAYEEVVTPSGPVLRYGFIALYEQDDEQALAGFAVTAWLPLNAGDDAEAELESVVVALRYRRQGVATSLLRACMLAAAQAGAASICLQVRTSNAAARALYEHNGFAAIGNRRGYYSAPVEDAVLLRAPLGSPHLQAPL